MKAIYLVTKRERLGLTQAQLAAKSGVSQNNISRLENGTTTNPGAAILLALATAVAVDPRALRFGPDPRRRIRRKARAAA